MAVSPRKAARNRGVRLAWMAVAMLGALALVLIAGRLMFPYPVGPEQPLPFSHYIHAGERQISCLFCHDTADRSQDAGMPPVAKCLLCHNVVITQFPPIQQLHGYYNRGEAIPWVRVYQKPDYVRFTHQMHLNAGRDCGECHGDVKHMDRIQVAMEIKMGNCINCHHQNNVRVDCTICHY